MAVTIKYIVGITLFALFGFLAVMSIMSLIATVRKWLAKKKSKKSPEEGKEQNVNAPTEETGKEVDEHK